MDDTVGQIGSVGSFGAELAVPAGAGDAAFRSIRSIERSLAVLELLAASPRLTVAQVARGSRLPRTTAYRVLKTLTLAGFASEWPEEGTYGPGPRLTRLAGRNDPRHHLVEVARPIARSLGQRLRWPISVVSVVGIEAVVLYTTDAESPLAINPQRAGVRLPMLESAGGLLHLAYASDSERALCYELLQDSMGPLAPNGRAAQAALDARVATIRTQGYAVYEREGRLTARRSVAAPILGTDGLVGSLVVRFAASAIRSREELARMIAALRAAAAEIKP